MPETITRQRNWAPWSDCFSPWWPCSPMPDSFWDFPARRAIPWLSVALAIAALVCAAVGIMRAFRQPQVYGGKVSSSILGVLSLLICGLVAVAAVTSRALPSSAAAPQVGQKVPDFTLADTNGNKISLGQLLGKAEHRLRHPPVTGSMPAASSERRNAAQGRPAGFLSWLLVTVLQPRVTRHPEKPERV